MPAKKFHSAHRTGWLRAAVLGANDGIISTASLLLGMAAARASHANILVAGVASLVAGATAMAAGEYVSVSSLADAEQADLALERDSLAADREAEERELAAIYIERGLESRLAEEVARQLMAGNALGAHARDELGFSEVLRPRPLQAALASAASFAAGASVPLLTAILVAMHAFVVVLAGTSLLLLSMLGGLAAYLGGAVVWRGALRVLLWGALALGLTAGVGGIFGATL